jgi:hypothetical protein
MKDTEKQFLIAILILIALYALLSWSTPTPRYNPYDEPPCMSDYMGGCF